MEQDFLDELIAKRAARNPEFPRMVEDAIAERRARPIRMAMPLATVQRRMIDKHWTIVIRIGPRFVFRAASQKPAHRLRSVARYRRERAAI